MIQFSSPNEPQWFLVSDLHLTDRPADEYRWELFPFLIKKISKLPNKPRTLFILGDLTERKDYHSAALTNRVVNALADVKLKAQTDIVILRGNHDGLDDKIAYFDFLNRFSGYSVITRPTLWKGSGSVKQIALLPHTRDWANDWALIEFEESQMVMMHLTVQNAVGENGMRLRGPDFKWLSTCKYPIFSGDVHVPQKVGTVEYVGAPYPIKFGDNFQGRVIYLNGNRREDWAVPSIRKESITVSNPSDLAKINLSQGDQVKIKIQLSQSDIYLWSTLKQEVSEWCEKKGVVLAETELIKRPTLKFKTVASVSDASPIKTLENYAQQQKVPDRVLKVGQTLLESTIKPASTRLRFKK